VFKTIIGYKAGLVCRHILRFSGVLSVLLTLRTSYRNRHTQNPVRQAMINAQAALATPSKLFPGEGKIEVLKHLT
jgi:hypothetical protein